jgi:hypothetical protein
MNKKDILEKVLKDEPKGFRKKFLDNPKKALEELLDQSLGDWKVEIHRIPKKTIVFDLPQNLPSPLKISQEILHELPGGREHYSPWFCTLFFTNCELCRK